MKAIEAIEIGRTWLGGKIFFLLGDPIQLSALKTSISTAAQFFVRKYKLPEIRDEDSLRETISFLNENENAGKNFLKNVYRYGHRSVCESYNHAFLLLGVSRYATFKFWLPARPSCDVIAEGVEMSLRRVEARDYVKPSKFVEESAEKSFDIYHRLLKRGIPKQDARYALAFSTKTMVMWHAPLGREVGKIANFLKDDPVKEVREIGKTLKNFNDNLFGINFVERPSGGELPIHRNEEEINFENFNPKKKVQNVSYDPTLQTVKALVKESITSTHQHIRNRKTHFIHASLERSLYQLDFVYPPTCRGETQETLKEHYTEMKEKLLDAYLERRMEDFLYSMPLGKEILHKIYIWNNEDISYTIALRTCLKAQHEIRGIYNQIMNEIKDKFPGKLGPNCVIQGKCEEFGKEKCQLYQKLILKSN